MPRLFKMSTHEMICEFASALGFDPETMPITDINIAFSVKEVPTVTVKLLAQDHDLRELVKIIQRYNLIPTDGEVTEERY